MQTIEYEENGSERCEAVRVDRWRCANYVMHYDLEDDSVGNSYYGCGSISLVWVIAVLHCYFFIVIIIGMDDWNVSLLAT